MGSRLHMRIFSKKSHRYLENQTVCLKNKSIDRKKEYDIGVRNRAKCYLTQSSMKHTLIRGNFISIYPKPTEVAHIRHFILLKFV